MGIKISSKNTSTAITIRTNNDYIWESFELFKLHGDHIPTCSSRPHHNI